MNAEQLVIDLGDGKQINIQRVDVTPELAKKILGEHYERIDKKLFVQRSISENVIYRYASDMRIGAWLLSPQLVAFDEDGNLIDGQHRLEAIVRSKRTVPLLISYGWPKETIDVLDRGRARTIGNQLQLHGAVNSNNLAAAVSSMARIAYLGSPPVMSYATTRYMLDTLGLKEHIASIAGLTGVKANYRGRVIGPIAWYHTAHPKKARAFGASLFNLELEAGTGPWLFARWQQDARAHAGNQSYPLRAICSAIRAYHNDERLRQLRPTPEAIQWMADLNPKLKDAIRTLHGPRPNYKG